MGAVRQQAGGPVTEIRWDLDGLCAGPEQATEALHGAELRAQQFGERYRDRVRTLPPAELASALGEMEAIQVLVERASAYAFLRLAANVTDPNVSAFSERCDEAVARIREHLLFFDLEWIAASDAEAEARLSAAALAGYRHHLTAMRRYRPHVLSEAEERILNQKSLTAREAWCRLYEESLASITVSGPGGPESLFGALQHLDARDAEERRAWAGATSEALRRDLGARSHALRAVVADKAIDDRLRGYSSWLASRNLANEIPDAAVESALDAVESRYDIPHRLYALKRRLLAMPVFHDWDRNARLGETSGGWTWDEARAVVLEAYGSVAPELRDAAELFFAERWIDASPGPGRQRLAFTYPVSPEDHPFVFLNFQGIGRDVLALAHELGHGIHALLSREQSPVNYAVSLVLAESASLVGETLTTERLLERERDQAARLGLIIDRVDDAARNVFAPVAGARFESSIHERYRSSGALSNDDLGVAWLEALGAMLGPSVEVSEDYAVWWSWVRQFVVAPGYFYAYALGNLLGLTMVAQATAEGGAFTPRYLRLLRAGGSASPAELLGQLGISLAERSTWTGGLDIIDGFLREAERLAETADPGTWSR
jgi:oligoendopeptidase F